MYSLHTHLWQEAIRNYRLWKGTMNYMRSIWRKSLTSYSVLQDGLTFWDERTGLSPDWTWSRTSSAASKSSSCQTSASLCSVNARHHNVIPTMMPAQGCASQLLERSHRCTIQAAPLGPMRSCSSYQPHKESSRLQGHAKGFLLLWNTRKAEPASCMELEPD